MKEYMQSGHTNMTFTVMQHSRPVSCYEKLVQLKLLTCTNNEENKKISNEEECIQKFEIQPSGSENHSKKQYKAFTGFISSFYFYDQSFLDIE